MFKAFAQIARSILAVTDKPPKIGSNMSTAQSTYDDILVLMKELFISQKETDLKFKETDKQIQEMVREAKATSKEVKAVTTSVGRLGNRLGEFVEEAVRPAAVRLFQQCGIDVHEVQQNISVKRDGEALEIDLLVVNDLDTVAIECKSNLSIDDVNEHLERLAKIKRMIPRYKAHRILGAVAGMVIPDNVAAYAIKKGLYVIAQNGGHLDLANPAVFVPKTW